MKNILVPTDFSELSELALSSAQFIAEASSGSIECLHVVQGPQGHVYCKTGELIEDGLNDYSNWHALHKDAEEKMSHWTGKSEYISDSNVIIGDVDKAIIHEAESKESDLIVIGTSGYEKGVMWKANSHTKYLVNHSQTPVLSLKCNRPILHFNKMVFVSDFATSDKINLSALKNFQDIFDSELILLKVMNDEDSKIDAELQIESFAKANNLDNYTVKTVKNSSIEEGVQQFCLEENIDLVALGTHQRSGFSKLFKQSVSDELVRDLFQHILTFPI